jgi:outer membrane protein OmpA-like peptidoglycan-associated protein
MASGSDLPPYIRHGACVLVMLVLWLWHDISTACAAPNGTAVSHSQTLPAGSVPEQERLTQSTRQPNSRDPQYQGFAVDGLAIGTRIAPNSSAYQEYQCGPSEQFAKLTWCTKRRNEIGNRGRFEVFNSFLHAPDGTVVYANHFQAPTFWSAKEVDDGIQQHSRRIGAPPNIARIPSRSGYRRGMLATWGKVSLQPIDAEGLKALSEGKAIKKGLLVDFIGDFSRSAREGLPVYQLGGGAGLVWVASYDETGRGHFRTAAVDASAFSSLAVVSGIQQPQPSEISQPPFDEAPNPLRERQPETQMQLAYADITADALIKAQAERDNLFKRLKANADQYTFDYLVITLPPGSLPGISVPVPVSHIRYNSTVFFKFDRSNLEPEAENVISDFAKTLLRDKSYRSVLVVGHTDSVGTDDYNYNLSKARAATVAIALRGAGILDKFLGIVPMGEAQPVTSNSTPEGRASNRRVEFFISEIPEATKIAIERIKFNPCYRNDHEVNNNKATNCAGGPTQIPILPASGEGRPRAEIDLSRSALPTSPDSGFRDPLPHEPLERPSLRELQLDK